MRQTQIASACRAGGESSRESSAFPLEQASQQPLLLSFSIRKSYCFYMLILHAYDCDLKAPHPLVEAGRTHFSASIEAVSLARRTNMGELSAPENRTQAALGGR